MDKPSHNPNNRFYGAPVPDFVDEDGNFVDADFRCDRCGEVVNVQFHTRFLDDMSYVYRWMNENAPCACNRPRPPAAAAV
jgi:hypothetical protein